MKSHLKIATILTNLLDRQFSVFGIQFGLDPIIGAIPGIGDFISLLLSLYLIWIGIKMKLPAEKVGKMVQNIIIDFVIGALPLVGDISDIFYRANYRNLQILQSHSVEPIIEAEIIEEKIDT